MDRNKIIDVMLEKTLEIYNSSESYQAKGKHAMLVVQTKSESYPERWDSTILPFGRPYTDPTLQDGYPISTGFSTDTTVHEKIAYVRRTGKNSGAPFHEVVGQESFWKGAVISGDGKCICAFSGFTGEDDVIIAEAGIAEYENQVN